MRASRVIYIVKLINGPIPFVSKAHEGLETYQVERALGQNYHIGPNGLLNQILEIWSRITSLDLEAFVFFEIFDQCEKRFEKRRKKLTN